MSNSKLFNGIIWTATQRFGTMIISFVANMVLARLLCPEDFGTIGMLMIFLNLANTIVDSGFGSALIQKKNANEQDYSTVFVINLILSTILYFVLFLCSPFIANFYGIPLLTTILRVQGLSLFINALMICQASYLRKQLDFKRLAVANLSGNIVGTIVSITMAALGCGVWSLVGRVLSVSLVTAMMLWFTNTIKIRMSFNKRSFKELFGFGGFMLLSNVLTTLSSNVQSLVIGKLFKPAELGNYTQARMLRNVGIDSVSQIICQVLYPDFSNNQNNSEIIVEKLNFSAYLISYLVGLIMGFCLILADPIIKIIYGMKWVQCIPYFQILCLGGVFVALQDVNFYVIAAKGKSKELFLVNVVKLLVYFILIIGSGRIWGMVGLLYSLVFYSILAFLVYSILAAHYLQTNVFKQYSNVFKSMIVVLPAAFIANIVFQFVGDSNLFVQLMFPGIIFIVMAIVVSHLLKIKPFIYLLNKAFGGGKQNNVI